MKDKRITMRKTLERIHRAATDEEADIMTHPTWALDYMLHFQLSVRELREIHEFLSIKPKAKPSVEPMLCKSK